MAVRKAKIRFGFSLALILVFVLFFSTSFKRVIVSGQSMDPYFKNGSSLLASNAYWLVGGIKDNDVVVIRGEKEGEYIVKRVYRSAGEVVDWYNVPKGWLLSDGEFRVKEGEIYVLGDNRAVSEDSRIFGPVPLSKVLGKIVLRP